jgi:hypothetical protein
LTWFSEWITSQFFFLEHDVFYSSQISRHH